MANLNPSESPQSAPWSLWPTLGLSFLIIVGFAVGGIVISIIYLGWELSQNPALASTLAESKFLENLNHNGTFLAWNTLFSGVVGLGLIAGAIRLKKGWRYCDYLNLYMPKALEVFQWNALLIGLIIVESRIARFFNKTSDFMENLFASDQTNLFLLFIAVVIMAPLFEEIFFRGFMYKGLEKSWLGTWGTVLVTSFIWAIIHIQYEPFFIGIIFTLGLLLGYARHVTKSLWIPISMHALNNGLAMYGAYAWLNSTILS